MILIMNKRMFFLLLCAAPLWALAQDTATEGWRNTEAVKGWVGTLLENALTADSATQAALVGAMAPYEAYGVTSVSPEDEAVRVSVWLDRRDPAGIGTRRFVTSLLLVGEAILDSEQSFLLAETQEVDNEWTPVRTALARIVQVDDSLKDAAQGSLGEVFEAYHAYFQSQIQGVGNAGAQEALMALDRLSVSQRECAEFLGLRAQVEASHHKLLNDYGTNLYSEALQVYNNHYGQCSLAFDVRLGRSEVRRMKELAHVQKCFAQYGNLLLLTTRKNQEMDTLFANTLGAEALAEYKVFYLQYPKSFDPQRDSASVSLMIELSRLQDDYVRFIEYRIRLKENNSLLESHTEKPYAKMLSDYRKTYSLLNQKMSQSAVETNARLQKAIENQEAYKRCISLYEHTLQQHDLMTDKVEKPCKDVIKVYKSYYKSNKPVYSGSVSVYDKQLAQLSAMQRAFQHMAVLRQQIESKNDAIHQLSERWSKPLIKAYDGVFEVLNLDVTPDTDYSIAYLKGAIDMQDSCMSYIHRYRKIMENNDVIESQKSKAKHIVKAYQGFYDNADMGWETKRECYKKLVRVAEVQKVFMEALQREDVEALDKSIKAMKKPTFETILNTLR